MTSNRGGKGPDLSKVPPIDRVGVHERAARFTERSIKKASKVEGLKTVLSMTDLTTLEGADTPGKVRQLCRKARSEEARTLGAPPVAAVCVYPSLVKEAKEALKGSGIKVASVATAFPSGQAPLNIKREEVKQAVQEGADEIDMVISRRAFLSGNYDQVFEEIATIREDSGNAHLKTILETGELGTLDKVRMASEIAMQAGTDFIKTSTGKVKPAATMPVTLVMLEAIRDHYQRTGQRIGMKPAGGISDPKLALHYLVMLRETLGTEWMNPELFRFGASGLLNKVFMQLDKEKEGAYSSQDYFSKD
jgi:deoxyribose-phosphate aldolase